MATAVRDMCGHMRQTTPNSRVEHMATRDDDGSHEEMPEGAKMENVTQN